MSDLGVGIIGCGNISDSYLSRARLFRGIEMRAVADLLPERAEAQAEKYGLRAMTVDGLLRRGDIGIVVNLTVPRAHAEVTRRILAAGRHVYSEKPLALDLDEARAVERAARDAGRRVGVAPDTFLGAAHQAARRALDDGAIGRVVHGTCHVMSAGMEAWHPHPDFFFLRGGGPVLDLGPYYVALLVHLIGPVARVAAIAGAGSTSRTIGSASRAGEVIPVETPTTAHALLEFASGAMITLGASWDCHGHGHRNVELYGTEGTLVPPDPNFFGGDVEVIGRDGAVRRIETGDLPLGGLNREDSRGIARADYRTVGLAEMAAAIREGREHRCSLGRALHATEVLDAVLRSAAERRFVEIETTCTRPEPFGPDEAASLMRDAPD